MTPYPLTDPFVREFIFDEEQIEFLVQKWKESEPEVFKARVYDRKEGGEHTNLESRNCDHIPVPYREFADVSISLKEMLQDWATESDESLWFAQYEFVRYFPGEAFYKHRDDDPEGSTHNRFYTAVTMIEKSEDLVGGNLKVWLPNTDTEIEINLEPFETVMFPAWFHHEASTVYQGKRVILISWAGKGFTK